MSLRACSQRKNGESFSLGGDSGARFIAMLGYSASLRVCLSGLALVKDISVTCFMRGGPLIGEATAIPLHYLHLHIQHNAEKD